MIARRVSPVIYLYSFPVYGEARIINIWTETVYCIYLYKEYLQTSKTFATLTKKLSWGL